MLKKMLGLQITVLIIEIAIGMTLLNRFDEDLKMVHVTVGTLVALASIATVYFAAREKAGRATIGLSVAALVFVVLAALGGKLTNTDYDQGLMLMRISAIVALGLSALCFYTARKQV